MAKSLQRANGKGSVQHMSGRRSKPWRAVVTIGWETDETTGKSKQLRQTIGYYESKDEATVALHNYNTNPYDITGGKQTFEEIYKKVSETRFKTLSKSSIKAYEIAFKRCEYLHKKKFKDINLDDLQNVIDYLIESGECYYPSVQKIHILFNVMYKYAVPRKLTDLDYSKFVDSNKHKDINPRKRDRYKFTFDQIDLFWNHSDIEIGKVVLMLIYSGVRITELLNLKKEDCHLNEKYFQIVKSKTESGIRKVPIADKILDFWLYFMNKTSDSEYLITMDGRSFEGTAQEKGYRSFLDSYWTQYMTALGMPNRQIHETRYTFISIMKKYKIEKSRLERIVGHARETVADRIYDQMDVEDLIDEVNRIFDLAPLSH